MLKAPTIHKWLECHKDFRIENLKSVLYIEMNQYKTFIVAELFGRKFIFRYDADGLFDIQTSYDGINRFIEDIAISDYSEFWRFEDQLTEGE